MKYSKQKLLKTYQNDFHFKIDGKDILLSTYQKECTKDTLVLFSNVQQHSADGFLYGRSGNITQALSPHELKQVINNIINSLRYKCYPCDVTIDGTPLVVRPKVVKKGSK